MLAVSLPKKSVRFLLKKNLSRIISGYASNDPHTNLDTIKQYVYEDKYYKWSQKVLLRQWQIWPKVIITPLGHTYRIRKSNIVIVKWF